MRAILLFLANHSMRLALVVIFFSLPAISVQRQHKFIDQNYSPTYPTWSPVFPVEIVDLKVNGRSVSLKTKFYEEGEWMKGLSWKVKNNWNKAILKMDTYLMFPQTKSSGPILAFPIQYGKDRKLSEVKGQARRIEPGEAAEFVITGEIYERLKRFIEEKMAIGDVSHLRLDINFVLFEDDSGWSLGQWMRRDPDKPNRWLDIKK